MEIQAELDRVATFKGGHINSSVLHGSQQRFPIKVSGNRGRDDNSHEGISSHCYRRGLEYTW